MGRGPDISNLEIEAETSEESARVWRPGTPRCTCCGLTEFRFERARDASFVLTKAADL